VGLAAVGLTPSFRSYWQKVVAQSLELTDFYALTHPSQPNYVGQIGEHCGVALSL
jgi:hypothetical protein